MTKLDIFQPIENRRLSDVVVRQIKDYIEQGILKPGDKLPSERLLVNQLEVSRTSVREALRVLEALGLVEVQPGLGAFVVNRAVGHALPDQWRDWLAQHKQEVVDLLDVREALEPKAVALAATRITEEELQALRDSLTAMREGAERGDFEAVSQADIRFHDLISQASGNDFLISLNDSINYALVPSRYAYFQEPERTLASYHQHLRVYEALVARDAEAGAQAMLHHVVETKELMIRIATE